MPPDIRCHTWRSHILCKLPIRVLNNISIVPVLRKYEHSSANVGVSPFIFRLQFLSNFHDPESAHRIVVIARDGDLKVNVRGGRYWVSGKKEKYSGNHFQN